MNSIHKRLPPTIEKYAVDIIVEQPTCDQLIEVFELFENLKIKKGSKNSNEVGLVHIPKTMKELRERTEKKFFLIAKLPNTQQIVGLLEAKCLGMGINTLEEFREMVNEYCFSPQYSSDEYYKDNNNLQFTALLDHLGVRKEYRLKGVASRLVKEMKDKMIEKGIKSILVEVLQTPIYNHAAFKFYFERGEWLGIGYKDEFTDIYDIPTKIRWAILEWFRL